MKLENLPKANELARLLDEVDHICRALRSRKIDNITFVFDAPPCLAVPHRDLISILQDAVIAHYEEKLRQIKRELEEL